jgi:hypothetical protein
MAEVQALKDEKNQIVNDFASVMLTYTFSVFELDEAIVGADV